MAESKSNAKDRLKNSGEKVRRFFNVKEWIGTQQLQSPIEGLKETLSRAFVTPPESEKNDFAETVQRMGITPEQLKKKQRGFLRLFFCALILALLVLCYALYHLFQGNYLAFFPSFVLFFVCLSFAFRYHFWYFQTKVQRLGCTFHDWREYLLTIMDFSAKK